MNKILKTEFLPNGAMPEKPTTIPSKIITIAEAAKLGLTNYGWQPTWNGVKNDKFGRIEHSFVIPLTPEGDLDKNKFAYDLMGWWDGKQTADGQTIPGEVFVPILWAPADPNDPTSAKIPWVLWFWEWRPTMMDWVPTVPGGFEPAKKEALQEAGLLIKDDFDSFEICGNRANVMNLTPIGFGSFEFGPDGPNPEKTEAIFVKARYATPLSLFPFTKDSLVNNAIAYTRQALGYTFSAPKQLTTDEAFAALKIAIVAESTISK